MKSLVLALSFPLLAGLGGTAVGLGDSEGPGGAGAETAAAADANPETITVKLSDPSRPAVLKASLVSGGITVEGRSGGGEVVVQARPRAPKRGHREGASRNGMRLIPNVGLGLTVEEEDNVVAIGTESWRQGLDLHVQVPANTSVHLGCVNDGDIAVSGVTGEIEISNVNGGIELRDVSGSVVAETVNGPVVVTFRRLEPGKAMAFSSFNGNVDVTFPADLKATVRMRSDQGEIYSDWDVQLDRRPAKIEAEREGGRQKIRLEKDIVGTINGGGPEIRFQTFNGNIFIRRAGAR
jgi:putative adhesin